MRIYSRILLMGSQMLKLLTLFLIFLFTDQCTITRTYLFLHKFWFFSTVYYFGNWIFIGVFIIGLIVSCCKGKKSVIEGEVEDDDSDLSDDDLPYA
ncbi:hypothetical protein AB205_0119390 [Aquarana catesbeiana]|uniref:Uncharacterized protein n=1 Tax=Aquarana catesbeiana TaxID=8400 RepID=A0A2G9SFA5_AQUCT|nr:hypothetical protein AB205_0119390 [Aquarana catesbeiana]